jgi:hypothetical protein
VITILGIKFRKWVPKTCMWPLWTNRNNLINTFWRQKKNRQHWNHVWTLWLAVGVLTKNYPYSQVQVQGLCAGTKTNTIMLLRQIWLHLHACFPCCLFLSTILWLTFWKRLTDALFCTPFLIITIYDNYAWLLNVLMARGLQYFHITYLSISI